MSKSSKSMTLSNQKIIKAAKNLSKNQCNLKTVKVKSEV